eukprot:3564227-Pyramimonas_sp.AAC.1
MPLKLTTLTMIVTTVITCVSTMTPNSSIIRDAASARRPRAAPRKNVLRLPSSSKSSPVRPVRGQISKAQRALAM